MVLSILLSDFFIYLWSGLFQPLRLHLYLNTSLVQLCPRTRKPSRQGEKEEMLWLSLVWNSLPAREWMLETLRWHVPLSAQLFLSSACLVPSSLRAFLYPFTLKGSEWSQAQSDPQLPKEALFDLLLKWWLTCNIRFSNLGSFHFPLDEGKKKDLEYDGFSGV